MNCLLRNSVLLRTGCSARSFSVASSRQPAGSGYDFFQRIGSPRFIAAPMVAQSELAFRLLTKSHGADLAYTQMIHARCFVEDKKYRQDSIDWRAEDYIPQVESPVSAHELDKNLIVQFAGDCPDTLARAASLVQADANVVAVDLNLGCPQKIAKKGHYGAYLLHEKELVASLLTSMVQSVDVPVTAKIRRLQTDAETLEVAHAIEQAGVSMLTVHGRTADSKKAYTGPVDWDIIRRIKQSVSIPVIANGGVSSRADALACLAYTGADGVMSSEGLLENPRLFSEVGSAAFDSDIDHIESQLCTVEEYLHLLSAFPARAASTAHVARAHIFKILYRFLDAPKNADLRMRLGLCEFEEIPYVVVALRKRMQPYARLGGGEGGPGGVEQAQKDGLLGHTLWYWRHRDLRASMRTMSTPRRKHGAGSTGQDAVRLRLQQQQQLKDRLLAQRAARGLVKDMKGTSAMNYMYK